MLRVLIKPFTFATGHNKKVPVAGKTTAFYDLRMLEKSQRNRQRQRSN